MTLFYKYVNIYNCTFNVSQTFITGGVVRSMRKKQTCQEKLEPYAIFFFLGTGITFMWSFYMIASTKEISVISGTVLGAFLVLLTLLLMSLGEAEG